MKIACSGTVWVTDLCDLIGKTVGKMLIQCVLLIDGGFWFGPRLTSASQVGG